MKILICKVDVVVIMDVVRCEIKGVDVLIDGGEIFVIGYDLFFDGVEIVYVVGCVVMFGLINIYYYLFQILICVVFVV